MEVLLVDKKKTGNLIKEARQKKNYTQSELGDLLCVSNKAVSRWENGDSFPDVGILENLAAVLDLRIQDIITGDKGIHDESAVTDIVRTVKLQQKEKTRKTIKNSVFTVALLCCIISGYSALGSNSIVFTDDSIFVYVISMIFSFILVLAGSTSQIEDEENGTDKFCKCIKVVPLLSLIWSMLMTWTVLLMVINGHTPFEMELSLVGPFINWQLISIFVLNLVIIALGLHRYEKKNETIHWGWFVSIATIYTTVLYGDMLHRMISVQGVIESLVLRTLLVLAAVGIFLVVAKIIKTKANRNKTIVEDE